MEAPVIILVGGVLVAAVLALLFVSTALGVMTLAVFCITLYLLRD